MKRSFYSSLSRLLSRITKGNRQHFAIGAGLRVKAFCIDMAYLAPTADRFALKNTARFTISYRPEGL